MANGKALASRKVIYTVAQAKTVEDLIRVVNDIIEHGWHSEGVVITGWRTTGGITRAQGIYLQALLHV